MLVFPNCKINLGLNILRKREDGFHDIETVFYPVKLRDALEISGQPDPGAGTTFTTSGIAIGGEPANNLCYKAYQLIKHDFPQLPGVKMHLHKSIPLGAGLGGGSADGAFLLKLINEKFGLSLASEQLQHYALQLGSDCPFFLLNKPCLACGRGEILEDIPVNLADYQVILVNPLIAINTGWAFSRVSPALPKKNIREIINQPLYSWKEELINDFEVPVFDEYPELKEIKQELYNQGAIYAAMSGSGSTLFGIFENAVTPTLFKGRDFFIKIISESFV